MIRGGKWCSAATSAVKDSPSQNENFGFLGKEFDTYKVGTVANSTSTMHTIHKSPITIDNFEIDDYHSDLQLIDPIHVGVRTSSFVEDLEQLRQMYLQYSEKAKEETDPNMKKEMTLMQLFIPIHLMQQDFHSQIKKSKD